MATLIAVFHELKDGSWDDMPVAKHFNVEVVKQYKDRPSNMLTGEVRAWPGKQKNVSVWVELANGKAVGFNENPSTGWTFPVINLKNKP